MGDGPSARFSVAGDCLDPYKVGVLALLGGCNKSLEALDDMFYLFTGLSSCHFSIWQMVMEITPNNTSSLYLPMAKDTRIAC